MFLRIFGFLAPFLDHIFPNFNDKEEIAYFSYFDTIKFMVFFLINLESNLNNT